jgi:hypothetical protein
MIIQNLKSTIILQGKKKHSFLSRISNCTTLSKTEYDVNRLNHHRILNSAPNRIGGKIMEIQIL